MQRSITAVAGVVVAAALSAAVPAAGAADGRVYRAGADTTPPTVTALYSRGTVGGITSLRYVVSDDSGKTWDAFYLYRNGAVVRQYRTPLGPAVKGRMYGYKLQQTPASFRGTFRFCVQSHDAAGNVSKPSCAKVRIR